MASSRPRQRFGDIIKNIDRIAEFTDGMDVDAYEGDIMKQFAVERALSIISEAAKKLEPLAEEISPEIPWRRICDFGNVIRHGYDSMNVTDVWATVQNELPPLRAACVKAFDHPDLKDSD